MSKFINKNNEILLQSLGHIEVVIKKSENKSYDEFMKNNDLKDISIMHIEQIGELAGKFTDEFKEKHQELNFYAIKGMRNTMIHDYSGISYPAVYDTIKKIF